MATLHPELVRRDNREITGNKQEIRLFGVLRNEGLRLPYFLEYYRSIGVDRFFFIDNGSVDGSDQFILNQPDCHLFHTDGSYGKSRAGVAWLNSLLGAFGEDHWILLTDLDELFVYPSCETAKLPSFCSWLDQEAHEAVYVVLLDMYSQLPIQQVTYRAGNDFRAACPYFDRDYVLVRRYGLPGVSPAFPPFEHVGGPRLRLCFPEQNTPAVWPRLRPKLTRRLASAAQRLGFLKDFEAPVVATQAYKVPLVKWRKNYNYINSHRLNQVKLSSVTGALLHFKYFQDFGKKIEDAVASGQHYNGAVEYKRYATLLASNPNLSLAYDRSEAYTSSDDLLRCGLIKTTSAWDSASSRTLK